MVHRLSHPGAPIFGLFLKTLKLMARIIKERVCLRAAPPNPSHKKIKFPKVSIACYELTSFPCIWNDTSSIPFLMDWRK